MVKKSFSTAVLGTVGLITTHNLIAPVIASATEITILNELDSGDLPPFSFAHAFILPPNAIQPEAVSSLQGAIAEASISPDNAHTTATSSRSSSKQIQTSGTLILEWIELGSEHVSDADDERNRVPLNQFQFSETLNSTEAEENEGEQDEAGTPQLVTPTERQPTSIPSTASPIISDVLQTIEPPSGANPVDGPDLAATASSDTTYVVQPGDTLQAIAQQQGISVQALAEFNGIANPDLIYIGASLRFPVSEAEPSTDENFAPFPSPESSNLTTIDSANQSLAADLASVPPSSLVSASDPAVPSWHHRQIEPNVPLVPTLQTNSQELNTYVWPARGILSSGYGWRWGRMHRGVDIAAPTGTPVIAAAAGTVTFAGWNNGGFGYLVDIRHADGSLTRYAHNSRLLVTSGQPVEQGQLIAAVGSTGYSTGPHLHFEIHRPNQGAVDPIAYLTGATTLPSPTSREALNASEPDQEQSSEMNFQRYKVAAGDTLAQISQVFDLTIDHLATVNGIANPDLIFTGTALRIPQNFPQKEEYTQTASDSTRSRPLPRGQQDSTSIPHEVSAALDGAAIASWHNRQVVKGLPLLTNLTTMTQLILQRPFSFIWPTDGTLLSGYGWRQAQTARKLDIAAPVGTPVIASADGVVTFVDWHDGGYGNLIEIRHPDGSLSRYAHNRQLLVSLGQRIRQGETIAAVGNTGYAHSSYLHFEIVQPHH